MIFSNKVTNKQGCPPSPLFFNIVLHVKSILIGKEEIKLSLFAHYMTMWKIPKIDKTPLGNNKQW